MYWLRENDQWYKCVRKPRHPLWIQLSHWQMCMQNSEYIAFSYLQFLCYLTQFRFMIGQNELVEFFGVFWTTAKFGRPEHSASFFFCITAFKVSIPPLNRYFWQSKVWITLVIFWPFDPAKNAIPRWCTGRRWHILMAVMRGNRVGGNWLMKWDELKNSHGTLIDWCTGREWPVNYMTVISAWWRLNIRFQRSSGRRTSI